MRVVLTNLSNKLYEESRFRLNNSALKYGISEINSFDFEDIKKYPFYESNKKILSEPKGIGYWLWKPFIILEGMKNISEGDIIVYADCGIEIIGNIDPLINICKESNPILLFTNETIKNKYWTKRDCFVIMGCDNKKYWDSLQCDAAFSLFKKSKESELFLEEWLHFCRDERVITSNPNVCEKNNFFGFNEHRWDQSVLSLLAIKYNIDLFRVPTQFGNHYKIPEFRKLCERNCISQFNTKQVSFYAKHPAYNSPYFQLLDHHRNKTEIKVKEHLNLTQKVFKSGKRRLKKIIKLLRRQ